MLIAFSLSGQLEKPFIVLILVRDPLNSTTERPEQRNLNYLNINHIGFQAIERKNSLRLDGA